MVYERLQTMSWPREGTIEPERDLNQCHLFAQHHNFFSLYLYLWSRPGFTKCYYKVKIKSNLALAGVAQLVGALSQRPQGHRFDFGKGMHPGFASNPRSGYAQEDNQSIFLSRISLSPSLSFVLPSSLPLS